MYRSVEIEGSPPSLLVLQYEDLVDPHRPWQPILSPTEIPVHPTVFESDVSYTQEFAARVVAAVPDSIRQDIQAIEQIIGRPLGIQLTRDGIIEGRESVPLEEFRTETNGQTVWVESEWSDFAINIGLSRKRRDVRKMFDPHDSLPIPKVKLDQYRVDPDKYPYAEGEIIAWHGHNIGWADLGELLYLRNFAITFNNFGLYEAGIA